MADSIYNSRKSTNDSFQLFTHNALHTPLAAIAQQRLLEGIKARSSELKITSDARL